MKDFLKRAKKQQKKMGEVLKKANIYSIKKNKKWIFIIIPIVLIIAAAVVICYYFFIYLKPNFSDPSQNFINSDTAEQVAPGSEISYNIDFKNTGNRAVDSLEIEVPIPENTSFTSSDTEITTKEDANTITFYFNNIEIGQAGKVNFIVTADKPLDNGTKIILDKVKFNYIIKDNKYSQDISSDFNHTIQSNPDFSGFSLKAVDENGGYLHMGDIIEYTLSVKNKGDMNATGVEIKSVLSKNVSIIEESVTGSGDIQDNTVLWDSDILNVNKSNTLRFKAAVDYDLADGELIENNSTISCDQGVKASDSTSEQVTLLPDFASSEILLSDANGGYLWAGETVNVKIIITNSGERKAESYSLVCPTPQGATYISRSGTPEGIRWSDDIRGLIWDLNNLDVAESREIDFQIKVNEDLFYTGGNIITEFKIESDGLETELEQASIGVQRHIYMTIVAMGDSLIAKSDWVQRFDQLMESSYPYADYNTIPSGVSGEMAHQGFLRFDSTVGIYNPQIIIIAYGTNDTGASLSNFRVHLEGLVMKSRKLGATVFLNRIGPLYYAGKDEYPLYNNEIIKIANKYSIPVIDVLTPLSQNIGHYLYGDGVHYTPEGSAVVAQTVFNSVTKYLDDFGNRK
jgi:uncharacterized repeat protein (TIGR01451 family)